jgi:hypothetical protein
VVTTGKAFVSGLGKGFWMGKALTATICGASAGLARWSGSGFGGRQERRQTKKMGWKDSAHAALFLETAGL